MLARVYRLFFVGAPPRDRLIRGWALVLALLALAAAASATVTGKTVSVTSTASTVYFGGTNVARVYVSMINDGPNTVVFRLYGCGETVVPVIYTDGATDGIALKINEQYSTDHNPRTQVSSNAFCAISVISNAAETASLRMSYE